MAQINKPSLHFNTVTYTGNGADRSITGVGFQPDWIWVKERTDTSEHRSSNSTTGSKNVLFPSADFAEQVDQYGTIDSFDADGFSITTGTTNSNYVGLNVNGVDMVTWHWKANGGTTSSNTDGSITSTVQANTTSGFSIVSYTGTGSNATVGHGLGSTPSVIFVKGRNLTSDWSSYHSVLGNTGYMRLNNSNAFATASTYWNDTSPDSSVFTVGTTGNVNGDGNNYIAYCFAEKKGFSKFGSYTGNGSTDGTFVYTGFKPAWVLLKNTTGDNWTLLDSTRDVDNPAAARILPNLNFAEGSSNTIDFYSNGFKLLRTDAGENGSGVNYVYMAFAEQPLVGTNNIPATAR